MGLKIVMFLGSGRGFGRARQARRFLFRNWASKPTRLLGVALFRWLCAEHEIPEEVVIFGPPKGDWDMLHELAAIPYQMPEYQRLRLREAIEGPRGVTPTHLGVLSEFLTQFLGGVRVRCVLMPEMTTRRGQLEFGRKLDEHLQSGDVIHVDLAQDHMAGALFSSSSAATLTMANNIEVAGLYVAEPAASGVGSTPVLMVERLNDLIEWSNAIAMFRQSALIGKLPDLFREEDPELARAIAQVSFAITTHQYDQLTDAFRIARRRLRALMSQTEPSLGSYFAWQLYRESEWIDLSHVADWQLEFARRALYSGDYLRAASMAQEAVLSAAIAKPEQRADSRYREKASRSLVKNRHRQDVFPVDPWSFVQLIEVREAMSSMGAPRTEHLRNLIREEERLREFIERAISFCAALISRFKRVPPL